MSKKTKAGRGIRYSDVSNASIRNILFEISKSFKSNMTFECITNEAMEYFDFKCPYTGIDIKNDFEKNPELFDLDHIVPQNKECCGLNIRGNMIFVKKEINSKKRNTNFEDFILNQTDGTIEEKNERIKRIQAFQQYCGYDPVKIKAAINPILERIYREVEENQKAFIEEITQKISHN